MKVIKRIFKRIVVLVWSVKLIWRIESGKLYPMADAPLTCVRLWATVPNEYNGDSVDDVGMIARAELNTRRINKRKKVV